MRNRDARASVGSCVGKAVGGGLAMGCRWRLQALGQGMQCDEPASKIRCAAIAIARGFMDSAGIVDTVMWGDVQEKQLRARAW